MRIRALVLSTALATVPMLAARAQAPTVGYTVTGSSGDWFLNFDVANGFSSPSDQFLYFFGVMAPGQNIVGTPSPWSVYSSAISLAALGGSSNVYNDTWIVESSTTNGIAPGSSLDGFVVHSTAADAPTSVNWFAFTYGQQPYNGPALNAPNNPGFEGVASLPVTSTPEPASIALMATGLVGVAGISLKRRRAHAAIV